MDITEKVDCFLKSAGYEYYCFISWPNTGNREILECANKLKDEIENSLKTIVDKPKVFMDRERIMAGDDWEKVLTKALCRSIAMVAICAPIYYHSAHKWCGLEWAGMSLLSKKRLPNEDFTSVIPVFVRGCENIPKAVARNQCIDLSKVILKGRKYYNTDEFRAKIFEIVEYIKKIASHIARNKVIATCEKFKLPAESAFADFPDEMQPFPFRKR